MWLAEKKIGLSEVETTLTGAIPLVLSELSASLRAFGRYTTALEVLDRASAVQCLVGKALLSRENKGARTP